MRLTLKNPPASQVLARLAVPVLAFLAASHGAPASTKPKSNAKAAPASHHAAHTTAHAIANFGAWRVAIHGDGAARVCYAYTRANPAAALPGRGEVALTVTERPNLRDTIAISTGVVLAVKADVTLNIGTKSAAFYPSGRSVFARDAAVTLPLLLAGADATLTLPKPAKGGDLTDHFSLAGIAQALAAARTACPAAAATK